LSLRDMCTGNAPPPLPWEPEGRAEANRARFINLLGNEWLPTIADVDMRLRAELPARVLDVACGTGWSSIAMAKAYPNITVAGVDLDHYAISAARRNAERAGVADRVTFFVTDAADLGGAGSYALVTILEALHDMSRPVEALSAARRALAEYGTLLVADGLVVEEFTVPASPRERTEYGWSVVSCLPGAMEDPQTAATGAVKRPSVLRKYALQAGLGEVEILPIHTDYWRFYRLRR
jgi:predicted O-methyltransferase YrrM